MFTCLRSQFTNFSFYITHKMDYNQLAILNRKVVESRPFDFIFDPEYSIPTSKNFYVLAKNAIEKTGEQGIQPIYESMFSDVSRFPKMQFVLKTESLPISWEEKQKKEAVVTSQKNNEIYGCDHCKFISKSNTDLHIRIKFENLAKSSAHKISINGIGNHEVTKTAPQDSPIMKQKSKCINKSTQTDYRDSETQTDPWIPPYDEKLNSLLFLKPEHGSLIEYEVNTIEQKRKIDELQKKLLTVDKRNLKTQIAITEKIERMTWLVKEQKIDYVNMTRMKSTEKLFYKKSVEAQMILKQREESCKNFQMKWKNRELENILNNKKRDIRKLEQNYRLEVQSFSFKEKFKDELYSTCHSNNNTSQLYNFY